MYRQARGRKFPPLSTTEAAGFIKYKTGQQVNGVPVLVIPSIPYDPAWMVETEDNETYFVQSNIGPDESNQMLILIIAWNSRTDYHQGWWESYPYDPNQESIGWSERATPTWPVIIPPTTTPQPQRNSLSAQDLLPPQAAFLAGQASFKQSPKKSNWR